MTMPLKFLAAAIAVAATLSFAQAPSNAASFSCMAYDEMNPAEQAVCDNSRLGALDERLDSWYRRALVRAGYFDQTAEILEAQRDWLQVRNACGRSVRCLRRAYRQRIEQLRNYVEHV